MTQANGTGSTPGLAGLVRAAQLPPPAERQRIRLAARVSLRRMAEELDVSHQAVYQWERGEIQPDLEHAADYAQLLAELAAATEVAS
jgi:DNA-binding XRE family transcriptional regulator